MAIIALTVNLLSGDPVVLHVEPSSEAKALHIEVSARFGSIPTLHELQLFHACSTRRLNDGTLAANGLADGSSLQAIITPALAQAAGLLGEFSTAEVNDAYRTQAWTDRVCTALSLLGRGDLGDDHVEALWGFVSASWLMGTSWLPENQQVVDAAVLSLAEQTCKNVAECMPRILGMSDDLRFQLCKVSLSVLEKVDAGQERVLHGEPTRKLIAFVGAVTSSFGDVGCWGELARRALRLVGRGGDARVLAVLPLLEDIVGRDVAADVAAEVERRTVTAARSEAHAVRAVSAAVRRKRRPRSLSCGLAAKHRRMCGVEQEVPS